MTLVKKRKLRGYDHISRSSDLAITILQGTLQEKQKVDKRRGGKTILRSSTRAAKNKTRSKGFVVKSSVMPHVIRVQMVVFFTSGISMVFFAHSMVSRCNN